ncbi:hypothetical protein lbkm_1178 [Lachnospiraceae bacterium KM106-2]|nr:hypothetical protein lbkm_1178 [Lachnospiraceae bacterium KM106-2]
MKLDFYYWSYQCPLNQSMLRLLEEYQDKLEIHTHDITGNDILAKQRSMYFPSLIVLDDRKRYFSPLKRQFLDTVCNGQYPMEHPYLPKLGTKEKTVMIQPLTNDNLCIACHCTGDDRLDLCKAKEQFLQSYQSRQKPYGYLNLDREGHLLGGVEYMPSIFVPYDIPKGERIAFLTCVYCSDEEYDYKSGPLRALENELDNDYDQMIVISDEHGIFPNGDLAFFLKNGFHDEGILSVEENYCTLHLLSKRIE